MIHKDLINLDDIRDKLYALHQLLENIKNDINRGDSGYYTRDLVLQEIDKILYK